MSTLEAARRQHEGIWYFAEHSVAAGAEPNLLEPQNFPGLLFGHFLAAGPDRWQLSTYWSGREAYEGSRSALERRSKLDALLREGYLHEAVLRKTPLWRRLTPAGLLLQAVALLGAVAALQTYGSWLFERPALATDLQTVGPIDVLEGDPVEAEARVYNLCRRERLEVRSAEAWTESSADAAGTSRQEMAVFGSPRTVMPGGDIALRLSGRELAPGLYPLHASIRAVAGLARCPRTFSSHLGEVKVWRRHADVVTLKPREGATGRLAWLDGVVEAGEALEGLHCQLTLETDHLHFGKLRFPGAQPGPLVRRPDLRLTQISWRLGAQDAFYRASFELSLESDGQATDWQAAARRIESHCRELEK